MTTWSLLHSRPSTTLRCGHLRGVANFKLQIAAISVELCEPCSPAAWRGSAHMMSVSVQQTGSKP